MRHLFYARYIIRHKWFVFVECCKLGIPIAGIFHDLSKLRLDEWMAYSEHFYGRGENLSDFEYAWMRHINRNPHHWQYWVLLNDDGTSKALDMPLRYRKEMLADWRGTGRSLGAPDTRAWYDTNKATMVMHPETRRWIEENI